MDTLQVGASPAGISRYTIELVRALDSIADADHEITAYVSESGRRHFDWAARRVRVVTVPGRGGTAKRICRQQVLVPHLMHGHADVIHYPDYLVALRRPAPFVLTIHDLAFAVEKQFYTAPQRLVRRVMHPIALKNASAVVADSACTHDHILRLYPEVPPNKVHVVPLGLKLLPDPPHAFRTKLLERLRLPERFVLSVCTREPRKNLDRLLHAFGRCPGLADESLVLVGAAGWGRDSLEVLAKYGPQLASRVHVTGFVDEAELAALFHLCRVFVYVSLFEGFGLPPLEALSCGAPVVVSDIPVFHEVLGTNALFVDPRNIDAIGAGIEALLRNADLRSCVSRRGRDHSRQFTWDRCAGRMLELYRETATASQKR